MAMLLMGGVAMSFPSGRNVSAKGVGDGVGHRVPGARWILAAARGGFPDSCGAAKRGLAGRRAPLTII